MDCINDLNARCCIGEVWGSVSSAAKWLGEKTVIVLDRIRKDPGKGDEFARAFKNVTKAWDHFRGTDAFELARGRVETISAFVDGIGVLAIPERGVEWYRNITTMMHQKDEDFDGVKIKDVPRTIIGMVAEVPLTIFEISSLSVLAEKLGIHSFGEFGDKLVSRIQALSICAFFGVDTVAAGYDLHGEWKTFGVQTAGTDFSGPQKAWEFIKEPTRWLPDSLRGCHRVASTVSIVVAVFFAATVGSPVLIALGLTASVFGVSDVVTDIVVNSVKKDRVAATKVALKTFDAELKQDQPSRAKAEDALRRAEVSAYGTHNVKLQEDVRARSRQFSDFFPIRQ